MASAGLTRATLRKRDVRPAWSASLWVDWRLPDASCVRQRLLHPL